MARSTASSSSGRESHGRAAVVELLDVDPGVIAALDRGQDDAAPAGVEEGDRGRLVAAGALVGVVPHERGFGDGGVDPAVDPREAGGDLVHGSVQIIDPSLERDGEVDEILLAASEQDELGRTDGAQLPPREPGYQQRDPCGGAGPDRDPLRGRERH